ncbi:MAG: glycerophosphodiester phosphodiesterase family protein [Phenylobacterium sp.]|uniref:glycerophosphodiester phosphodiesterase family protein n=1 Tax=Phenylobacterium sp. TaxID=1871053 RepID=UPI0017C06A1A|nr:glycerophosphodiester phosphodiesterase family protein [Phenylobacterium sp.]MBA4794806.1 glycerophosphodiester phosphodiesterase family protein [Phenylobacterium sp.]
MTHRLMRRLAGVLLGGALAAGAAGGWALAAPAPNLSPPAAVRAEALRDTFLDPTGRVMVVAHRGCWKQTAENAVAGIEACVRLGVDMVELDVQRTRDGHLVLMHDTTVDRTTNGTGRVADLTLAEVKALRLKAGAGGPGAPLTDWTPPTFAEAMAAARGRVLVNVDAKGDVNDQALRDLDAMGLAGQALFKSAAPPETADLAAILSREDLLFMPILREADGTSLALAPERYPRHPPAYELTFDREAYLAEGAPGLRARQARIWVNTLQPRHAAGHVDAEAVRDPEAHWGRLLAMGASIIQTDEPGALIAWLAERSRASAVTQ